MFWDKKKSTLPDLPNSPATDLPNLAPSPRFENRNLDDPEDNELHELPSFPDSPMQRGFSQAAIKEAVTTPEINEFEEVPYEKPNESYKVQEIPNWPKPLPSLSAAKIRESKPIFVRIDKFQIARNSLESVKLKLSEIESLLKQIRDIKAKEDAELSAWESDMENIKARIQSVISDVFNKIED